MPCIDFDELPALTHQVLGFCERWRHWTRFRRSGYLGQGDLKAAVQDKVYALTGEWCEGRGAHSVTYVILGTTSARLISTMFMTGEIDGNICWLRPAIPPGTNVIIAP